MGKVRMYACFIHFCLKIDWPCLCLFLSISLSACSRSAWLCCSILRPLWFHCTACLLLDHVFSSVLHLHVVYVVACADLHLSACLFFCFVVASKHRKSCFLLATSCIFMVFILCACCWLRICASSTDFLFCRSILLLDVCSLLTVRHLQIKSSFFVLACQPVGCCLYAL